MELQITTLIENMPDDMGELACEHGLSLYIEFAGKRILFDTGQTGEFFSNARRLGKSIADVDYVIISHGHYDHSGGVPRLVEELAEASVQTGADCGKVQGKTTEGTMSRRPPLPMYVGAEFFHKKYKHLSDGSYRYNGNGFDEADLPVQKVSLHKLSADITCLEENIIIFKNFKRFTDFEKPNPKFVVERVEAMEASRTAEPDYQQDDFRD